MAVKPGNLPIELTGFVGRQTEIAEARRLLSESRLVTLTGPGGVGKTRLALRIAEDSRLRTFVDGTWLVELGELRDPALLEQVIVSALGIQDRSARPPRTILIEHLDGNRLLLVLDNCEHLIAAVAEVTVELLRNCPGLSILATSREPLGVAGEYVMRVAPMATADGDSGPDGSGSSDDALLLFEQRAQAALPDFRLAADNRNSVRQICRRLEGLPLPIELAAARLRAMSVDEVLSRLEDRFRLLTRGSRNAPSRQQALRYSIDWSYDLCTPDEQWLWTRLTVFSGTFDWDAVDGVLGELAPNGDLLDPLMSLVDKSVLIRDDIDATVRYRMLETLRDYGRERFEDPDEYRNLQRRHRDWYEALLVRGRAEWIGPHQVEWTARLEGEQANFRDAFEFSLTEPDPGGSALHLAVGLPDYWILRGRLSEGRYWFERALARTDGPPQDRLGAIVTGSLLAALQRDVTAASALADEATRLADELHDAAASAAATFAVGIGAIADGDLPRGIGLLEQAIDRFRVDNDLSRLVPALYWLGCAYFTVGDVDRAAPVYEEQLRITESRGEVMWRSMALSDYGSTLWRRGDRERGRALLDEALAAMRRLVNLFGCAWCFEEAAWAAADTDPELAAMLLGAAAAQFAATGSPMDTFALLSSCHDTCMQTAQKALGDKGFDTAFALGRSLSPGDMIARALGEQQGEPEPQQEPGETALTAREQEVADLVAQGLTNKVIAEKLVISQRTVEGHVEHIRDKLGFSSRTQIATWVLQHTDS
ncbi:LuxR C-terminal-related transcriptional regulator [Prescottella sp. R16]|uniref:ATP-binding protein n=1 Tax=Prescottella sp. R16 TaxID=3064529 RepID=UPI00272E5B5A|nr:LuxR C-terminal-related transcriptional regulator [Prescottella sp. R16]